MSRLSQEKKIQDLSFKGSGTSQLVKEAESIELGNVAACLQEAAGRSEVPGARRIAIGLRVQGLLLRHRNLGRL